MSKSPGGALLSGVTVQRDSGVPIYRQLDASLRRLILDGTLAPGQKLPSTRVLSRELGISRITVKSVFEQLNAEGYVQSKTGAGTFVSEGLDVEARPKVRPVRRTGRVAAIQVTTQAQGVMSSRANIRHGVTTAFRPGVPALDKFPVKIWQKYLADAANSDRRHHMSYGDVAGSPNLRGSIARHLNDARGMQIDAEQIIITSGAQQAFVLIALVLLGRGDTVWYEDPGHIAGRDVMRLMGASIAPVPIDGEGLDLDFATATHPRPELIFTTPSHQQPLGITMSLGRRLALLNFAIQNETWIIEDDYDSEFRYRGRPLPALSALDKTGRVLYVGTFSKSMFAALRIGYIVVPPSLVDSFTKARTLIGQGSSAVAEEALSRFMDDGRFVEHIRRMRRVYRARRDVLFDCINRECADVLDLKPTDAGMHALAWLNDGRNDQGAHENLLEVGIEQLPLSVYCLRPMDRPALVLGFACAPESLIPTLVARMSDAFDQKGTRRQ